MSGTAQMEYREPLRLLAADLSLRCPGFAVQRCVDGKASVDRLLHLDSRASKSGHGQLLSGIFDLLTELAADVTVFVRERGFSRFPHETQALYKVFGVADLAVWRCEKAVFHELAPTAIKKLLTGSGRATKEEVAAELERYVGRQCYATDDESDAVAAGIAWLKKSCLLRECP